MDLTCEMSCLLLPEQWAAEPILQVQEKGHGQYNKSRGPRKMNRAGQRILLHAAHCRGEGSHLRVDLLVISLQANHLPTELDLCVANVS